MTVKKIIKYLIPNNVFLKLQNYRIQKKAKDFESLSTQEIFSKIYKSGVWGKSSDPNLPFYSGSGSHDKKVTNVYLAQITSILQNLPKKPNVVDLGCGDFSIGSKVRPFCNNYIACDIVPELIIYNKEKYKNFNVDFKCLDLITDPLPKGDIVFIRQVLQHLSNEQILKFVSKIYSSCNILILTEHLPKLNSFKPNLDKPAGPDIRTGINSGIVLTEPPFNLIAVDKQLICEVDEDGGIIRTILYRFN